MDNSFIKKLVASTLVVGTVLTSAVIPSMAANKNLEVVNITGSNIIETSNSVNEYIFKGNKEKNLYLVNADDFADALTGGVLVGENGGSILFVTGNKVNNTGMARIKNAENVYIIGGEEAIPSSIVKGLSNFRGRIAGSNRVDTSIKVAEKLGGTRDIIIANATNFPDSLSAAGFAVKTDRTILLTTAEKADQSMLDYVANNKDRNIYFVGGSESISKATKEEIFKAAGKDIAGIDGATIAGSNRYETSLKIAEKFGSAKKVILANGTVYGDALLATTLSANKTAPVVLVDNNSVSNSLVNYLKKDSVESVYGVSTESNLKVDYLRNVAAQATGVESDKINVVDQNGNTIKLLAGAKEQPKEEQKAVSFTGWATMGLNVRSGASTSNSVIGSIAKGTKVTGTVVDGWIKFSYNGKEGYVSQKYLSTKEVKLDAEPAKQTADASTQTAGNDKNFQYSRVITMNATAYTADPRENGGWSVTALGTPLKRGVVAVDPRVIPLRTKLYIEGYGYARAEDTGGAIKGNKIDLLMESAREMRAFGRRPVKVYILK